MVKNITRQLTKNRFIGAVVRSILMMFRKLAYGNPIDRDIYENKMSLCYQNGMQLKAILAFPTREQDFSNQFADSLRDHQGTIEFIDIGAHIGLYACGVAACFEDIKVHAFEPDINSFSVLERNVALNDLSKKVKISNKAIGKEAGKLYLNTNSTHGSGSFSILKGMEGSLEIEIETLDQLYKAGVFSSPTHLLIDVEGAEHDVLLGGRNMLCTCGPTILLEIHPKELEDFGSNIFQLYDFLTAIGYQLAYLRTPSGKTGEHKRFHAIFVLEN